MTSAQENTYHSDKSEDKTPDQQKGVSGDTDVTDGVQDHDNRYKAPKTKVMQGKQKSRSDEIRTRSGYISHKPES